MIAFLGFVGRDADFAKVGPLDRVEGRDRPSATIRFG